MHLRTSALALLVVAACQGTTTPASATDPTRAPLAAAPAALDAGASPVTTCLATLSIDHGASVLSEQRRVGPHSFDFQDRYAAVYLDPDAQIPVATVAEFKMGGAPLLWFTPDRTAAVVNAAVLSDLVVADVTRMRAGETATIGQLTELGLGRLPGRDLVTFLIRARAIATYVHIGAELCLADERTDDAGYHARFTGEHTYFTNEKNVEPLAFEVTVATDGTLTVRGLPR